jgi:predicted nucleic acid-binding protein
VIATNLLDELWKAHAGVLSMQVLQEFYFNSTRKGTRPLSIATARQVVDSYSPWCVSTTPAEISTAFQIEDQARISFWDALLVAAAVKSGAVRIVTEDLNPGQVIAGVRIENPFS